MKITELENKHIKIGKTSITVFTPETGKTCGVVRNICKFTDLRGNRQVDYFKQLREAGAWGSGINGIIDSVIIADGQLYYLHNIKAIEDYNRYFAGCESFGADKECYEKRLEIADKMQQYAKVIPCYIYY